MHRLGARGCEFGTSTGQFRLNFVSVRLVPIQKTVIFLEKIDSGPSYFTRIIMLVWQTSGLNFRFAEGFYRDLCLILYHFPIHSYVINLHF